MKVRKFPKNRGDLKNNMKVPTNIMKENKKKIVPHNLLKKRDFINLMSKIV